MVQYIVLLVSSCCGLTIVGDEESHTDQSSREFFVIKCAYQVYLEYQKQLLCDVDGESRSWLDTQFQVL